LSPLHQHRTVGAGELEGLVEVDRGRRRDVGQRRVDRVQLLALGPAQPGGEVDLRLGHDCPLLLHVDPIGAEIHHGGQRVALGAAAGLEQGLGAVGELLAPVRRRLEDEELLLRRPQGVEAADGLELRGQHLLGGRAPSGRFQVSVLGESLELGQVEDHLVEGGAELEPVRRIRREVGHRLPVLERLQRDPIRPEHHDGAEVPVTLLDGPAGLGLELDLRHQRAGAHPPLLAGPDAVELAEQRLEVVPGLIADLLEGDGRGGEDGGEDEGVHPPPPGPPGPGPCPGPPPPPMSPGTPTPNMPTKARKSTRPTQTPARRRMPVAAAKPTPIRMAAVRVKRSSESSRPASFGPAWSQAPSEEGSRCRARSSVTPSCHRATTPHSARWRAMGSIPTADALNSAANGAFLPRSQAMTARAMAIPSTTSGVTHTPLAMAVTSLSRPAVVICSVSSASGIPLSCPDISSFWRMPGAGSQRRAKAAPAKDVAAMRASSGQRMRRSWTALATPVPGSVSVRGRVSAVIGKCPALRRLGDVIAPGFRQWLTPSGTPSASGL